MLIKHKFLAFVLVALLTVAIAACSAGEPSSAQSVDDRALPGDSSSVQAVEDFVVAEDSATMNAAPPTPPAAMAESAISQESRPVPATALVVSPQSQSRPTAVPEAMSAPSDEMAQQETVIERVVEVEKEVAVEAMIIQPEPAAAQSDSAVQSGPAGEQGPAGPAGAMGATGAQGSSGPQGTATMGRAGPPGPVGPAGPQGAPAGSAGPPGHAGTGTPPFLVGTAGTNGVSPSAPTPAPSTAPRGSASGQSQPGATTFQDNPRRPTISTYEDAVSTFSLDTDRTSYRLALNWAREGYEIEPDSVRAEEWINSFGYGYDHPVRTSEFAIHTDVFQHPLEGNKYIARVGIQAPDLQDDSRPLNVTLVLDASGSMADGNRIDIARQAAESIRQSLRPQDSIAVVHFSDVVLNGLTVRHTSPGDAGILRSIQRLQPGGATNVQAGLNQGVQLADDARRRRPDAINYVILMSDGVANVDATNPFAILETVGDSNNQNPLRLVTIGVGIANYNDYLLEQLAQHGNGWYRYLDNVQQAQTTFSEANWLNLAIPFADQTRAQVSWDPSMVRTWRIVGYENRVAADVLFTQDRKEFAEIPSGTATTVFYELELTDQVFQRQASTAKFGDIEIRWVEPGSGASREQYGVVSGHWRQEFDTLGDPLLKLGVVVALAADRYSGLPYSGYVGYSDVNWELSDLQRRLRLLQGQLGHLTAYQDFTLILDHMTRFVPPEPPRPSESGYSP